MKGSYILIVEVKRNTTTRIGKLGMIHFKKGYYAYVGSALNGLEKRIEHHLRHKKRIHWHIDYLLQKAMIREVWYKEGGEECSMANNFSFPSIKNFGCSDCKCKSHLFYSPSYKKLVNAIRKIGMKKYEICHSM